MSRTVEQVIEGVITELERSITIHGDWSDYSRHDMYRAIRDEFEELQTAWYGGDDTGEHGIINEARQLAVCCIKLLICTDRPTPPHLPLSGEA
jgi:hypothetical protein